METMTESTIDKRLDDLRADTSRGLARVDSDLRELGDEGRTLRAEMKAGFDGLQRQMTRFFAGTLGTVIAGVVVNVILSHS